MNAIFKITGIAFLFLFLLSCSKEEKIIATDTTVGHSRITEFPILEMKGEEFIAVAMGTPFVEPGVTAKEGSNVIPVITTGTVNTTTAGVYRLNYTAVNKDGFSSSLTRVVAVYSTAADAAANDFSGRYARTSNGVISTWTKIAPGVYTIFNPGGAPGNSLVVIGINPAGMTIKIPPQALADGTSFTSGNEMYTNSTPPRYSLTLSNPGYGPALRTFIKQ